MLVASNIGNTNIAFGSQTDNQCFVQLYIKLSHEKDGVEWNKNLKYKI